MVGKSRAKDNVNVGAGCMGCPLRDICPTAKNGRKVVVPERHGQQQADLAAAKGRRIGFPGREGLVRALSHRIQPVGLRLNRQATSHLLPGLFRR